MKWKWNARLAGTTSSSAFLKGAQKRRMHDEDKDVDEKAKHSWPWCMVMVLPLVAIASTALGCGASAHCIIDGIGQASFISPSFFCPMYPIYSLPTVVHRGQPSKGSWPLQSLLSSSSYHTVQQVILNSSFFGMQGHRAPVELDHNIHFVAHNDKIGGLCQNGSVTWVEIWSGCR